VRDAAHQDVANDLNAKTANAKPANTVPRDSFFITNLQNKSNFSLNNPEEHEVG